MASSFVTFWRIVFPTCEHLLINVGFLMKEAMHKLVSPLIRNLVKFFISHRNRQKLPQNLLVAHADWDSHNSSFCSIVLCIFPHKWRISKLFDFKCDIRCRNSQRMYNKKFIKNPKTLQPQNFNGFTSIFSEFHQIFYSVSQLTCQIPARYLRVCSN